MGKNNSIPQGRIGLKKFENINPSKRAAKQNLALRKFVRTKMGAAKIPKRGDSGGGGGLPEFNWAVADIWSAGHPARGLPLRR